MARKRRTRQHVIADLGINHVERQALLAGFAIDRVQPDYEVDSYVSTYDDSGAVENGYLLVQVKATDHLTMLADQRTVAQRVERADVDWWVGDLLLVVLVVYDAQNDVAYCLDVQPYFAHRGIVAPGGLTGAVTIHLPIADRLDAAAFRRFAARKNAIVREGAS